MPAVSDPFPSPMTPLWFNFDQSFQIPNPASTDPLEPSSFEVDFFNPLSLPPSVNLFPLGESSVAQ